MRTDADDSIRTSTKCQTGKSSSRHCSVSTWSERKSCSPSWQCSSWCWARATETTLENEPHDCCAMVMMKRMEHLFPQDCDLPSVVIWVGVTRTTNQAIRFTALTAPEQQTSNEQASFGCHTTNDPIIPPRTSAMLFISSPTHFHNTQSNQKHDQGQGQPGSP